MAQISNSTLDNILVELGLKREQTFFEALFDIEPEQKPAERLIKSAVGHAQIYLVDRRAARRAAKTEKSKS